MGNPTQPMVSISTHLLDWYDQNKRVLPWRTHPSLYKTIVSEFMAQQTQVKTMLPYFNRWLIKYPDIATLSIATEEEVVRDWEGLGYYRRARNLRNVAIQWMQSETKPDCYEDWLQFPGIGPYMAAAIASIDFDETIAAVDGNVIRVISRLSGLTQLFKGSAQITKVVRPIAQKYMSHERPGDFNQAIMEFGATVCTPSNPKCKNCPLVRSCKAFTEGTVGRIPNIEKKKSVKVTRPRLLVFNHENCSLLLAKGQLKNRLHGIYELPLLDNEANASEIEQIGTIKRAISNELITEPVFQVSEQSHREFVHKKTEPEWIPLKSLTEVSLSGPHRKWISDFLSSSEDSC